MKTISLITFQKRSPTWFFPPLPECKGDSKDRKESEFTLHDRACNSGISAQTQHSLQAPL